MRWLGLTAFLVPFGFSLPALADVPPADVCGEVGVACQHAEPDFKSPGMCTKTTCTRRNLSTGKDYEYACLRCVPTGKKAPPPPSSSVTVPVASTPPAPAPTPPAPASVPTPAPPPPPPEQPKSGGCGISTGSPAPTGLVWLLAAAFGFRLFRRGR